MKLGVRYRLQPERPAFGSREESPRTDRRHTEVPAGQRHDMADEHPDETESKRTTAPQSDYTARDVAVGAVVAAAGLAVVFGVPALVV
jgi:hypothetical protein